MQDPNDGLPDLLPEDLIELLREAAQEETDDLNEGIPETAFKLGLARKHRIEDTLEWDAANCIEQLLKRIDELKAEISRILGSARDCTGSSI